MRNALVAALFCLCQAAWADNSVHEFKLDNGLKLIVKEDHRAPVVVSQVWYRVGASYEHDGITGVSHVLEHMMFKGTEKYPAGEFSRIISANGGRENAFTSKNYTGYYQRLEKDRLPISFELEADRMRNLRLTDKEFQKEVKVVMEERRLRTDDKPTSLTYEQFIATAFINSSSRLPTIGWMNDLENMEVGDLQVWYERWYAPNNAIVVVAGDVDPEAVHKLAKKYFGPLKPEILAVTKPRTEPKQLGLRQLTVKVPAEIPYLLMGYKVPSLKTAEISWEPYALEVMASILDGGDSARISKELVRGSQIVSSAGAGYDLYDLRDTLFLLDATPSKSSTTKAAEAALIGLVKQLQSTLVSQGELDRIKAQVVAGEVYEQDSVFYQAMQIGRLEAVNLGWQRKEEYLDRIKAVTPEQIQAVAKKYLVEEHLTIARLEPLPIKTGSGK